MKLAKIILIASIFAVAAFFIYKITATSQKSISPLPEEGIKVIQISPTS